MGDAMKLVFCEGKGDVAVVRGLVSHLELDVQVEAYGGKQSAVVSRQFAEETRFRAAKVKAMAILRDANGDSKSILYQCSCLIVGEWLSGT